VIDDYIYGTAFWLELQTNLLLNRCKDGWLILARCLIE